MTPYPVKYWDLTYFPISFPPPFLDPNCLFFKTTPQMPIALKIIVVGGGICGLSCAIALRRAGHHVTVYEKYAANADAGAGIVLNPNAATVLRQWGLDLVAIGAVGHHYTSIIDGKTLKILNEGNKIGDRQMITTTRSDVNSMLKTEAQKPVDNEGTIEILYSKEVVDYDANTPAIRLADGSWQHADLIVACDGIRSKAVLNVVGSERPAKATGFSAFRLLLPDEDVRGVTEKYRDDESIRAKFEKGTGRIWIATEHPGKIFVWWTCRFGQVHALDIIVPDNDSFASSEEWLATCDKKVLIEEFRHWHPIFSELIETADEPLLWKICSRDPLDILHREKLCILGDALHPMGPYRAQGGSQAIEDAGVLEICFTGIQDRSEIAQRLQTLQKLRVPRYASAQMVSTVRSDEPHHFERTREVLQHCKKWVPEEQYSVRKLCSTLSCVKNSLTDNGTVKDLDAWNNWMFTHDVREEARIAVA